jgi:hypothetical protein
MKLTGAAILVSRGMKVLQAAPAAYPYRFGNTGEGWSGIIIRHEHQGLYIAARSGAEAKGAATRFPSSPEN